MRDSGNRFPRYLSINMKIENRDIHAVGLVKVDVQRPKSQWQNKAIVHNSVFFLRPVKIDSSQQ